VQTGAFANAGIRVSNLGTAIATYMQLWNACSAADHVSNISKSSHQTAFASSQRTCVDDSTVKVKAKWFESPIFLRNGILQRSTGSKVGPAIHFVTGFWADPLAAASAQLDCF